MDLEAIVVTAHFQKLDGPQFSENIRYSAEENYNSRLWAVIDFTFEETKIILLNCVQ